MTDIAPPAPAGSELVPGWLQRLAAIGWRVLVTILLGLVLTAIAVKLATVTISILVAAIVAATFAPYVLTLRNRGWSRIKAAAAVFVGAAVVIIATLAIIAVAFLPYIAASIAAFKTGVVALRQELASASIPPEVGQVIDSASGQLETWLSTNGSSVAADIGELAAIAILGTFLTFFFMMDGDKAWTWAMSSVNAWRREAIATAGDEALQRVGGYLRGTAVIAAFAGSVTGLFLWILGVPLAGPLGVIVFFGRFIPYVGGFVTTILIVLVTLGTVGSTAAIVVLVLASLLTLIQGKFLAPVIYHKTVHMHPALVLIALPAGAAVAGIIGLFAAIPVVAFALAIVGALVSVLGVEPTREPLRSGLVPTWLDRLGQWSWRLLVAIGLLSLVVVAAVQIPIVVMPLVLGVILAATLAPLGALLERRGWSRSRAALGATLGGVVVVTLIVGLTIVALVGPIGDLVGQANVGAGTADNSAGGNAGTLVTLVQTFGAGVLLTIANALSSLAALAVVLLLAILLTYYFMRDGDAFWRGFLERVEPGRRSYIEAAGSRAFNVLGGYMLGTGAISIFGAATQFLIMVILGIPFALPLAVLAVFGGFIPYIGSLITTGLAFLVTVATGSPQDVAIMAVFTIVFNIVQGNFVAPIVYSRVVSLHPAVVLAAIPAGNEIAGVVGMFLVVPFLGVVAAVWRTVLLVLDTQPVEPLAAADPTDPAADPVLSTAPSA